MLGVCFFLFPCGWHRVGLVLGFNISGIITCLPFIMILLISAMSSQNVLYILICSGIWCLFSGHPIMMNPFSHSKWLSCAFGLLYLQDWHAFQDVCHCLYCVYLYVHSVYLCIFVLCIIVSVHPVCNERLWSWACILSWPRIGLSWGECIIFFATGLLYLLWILLLEVYDWI